MNDSVVWELTFYLVHLEDELRAPGQSWEMLTDGECQTVGDVLSYTYHNVRKSICEDMDSGWIYDVANEWSYCDDEAISAYASRILSVLDSMNDL